MQLGYCGPRQHPSTLRISVGDVITTEITVNFFDFGEQLLRTLSVGEELTPLYRELQDVAYRAYEVIARSLLSGVHASEVVAASREIEDAGFTTYVDLVHGYGGGYLPPILGSTSRSNEPVPDMVLEQGLMLVVQPNVVTIDHWADVQIGERPLVGPDGPERLHTAEQGTIVVDVHLPQAVAIQKVATRLTANVMNTNVPCRIMVFVPS